MQRVELRIACGSFQGRGETGRSIVARLKFLRLTSRTRVQVIAVFFSSPSASNGYSCRRFAWLDTPIWVSSYVARKTWLERIKVGKLGCVLDIVCHEKERLPVVASSELAWRIILVNKYHAPFSQKVSGCLTLFSVYHGIRDRCGVLTLSFRF